MRLAEATERVPAHETLWLITAALLPSAGRAARLAASAYREWMQQSAFPHGNEPIGFAVPG